MPSSSLDIYLHDGSGRFRIRVAGALVEAHVDELEHAWATASSILHNKELVLELDQLHDADPAGLDLLDRLRQTGARLVDRGAALPGNLKQWLAERRPLERAAPPAPRFGSLGRLFSACLSH